MAGRFGVLCRSLGAQSENGVAAAPALALLVLEAFFGAYQAGVLRMDMERAGISTSQIVDMFAKTGLFRILMRTFAWVLILIAIFGGKRSAAVSDSRTPELARPRSIMILAWLLILLALLPVPVVLMAIVATLPELGPEFLLTLLFIITISVAFQMVIGIGMLNGRPWARLTFLWVVPVFLVVKVVLSPGLPNVFWILIYVLYFVYLKREESVRFFNKDETRHVAGPSA